MDLRVEYYFAVCMLDHWQNLISSTAINHHHHVKLFRKCYFLGPVKIERFFFSKLFLSIINCVIKSFNQNFIWFDSNHALTGYPPSDKVCEWSAVTTISVSFVLSICVAIFMALENSIVSSSAMCAWFSCKAWSIRPPSTNRKKPFGFVCKISMAFIVISFKVGIVSEIPSIL